MASISYRPLFASFLLASVSVSAAPQVVLDETFADGERMTQALPASIEWMTSGHPNTVNVVRGALTQAGGGRHLLGYFAPEGTPVEIAPGEALLLTYAIAVKSPADAAGALRVGLFDSGGVRIVTDRISRSDDFTAYRGYMGTANPAPTRSSPLRVLKRTHDGDTLVSMIEPFSSLGVAGGRLQPLPDDQVCTGTLRIDRPSPGLVTVTHAFSGGALQTHTVTAVDGADVVTRYDTVIFHSGSKATDGFTLTSVRIEVVPAESR